MTNGSFYVQRRNESIWSVRAFLSDMSCMYKVRYVKRALFGVVDGSAAEEASDEDEDDEEVDGEENAVQGLAKQVPA